MKGCDNLAVPIIYMESMRRDGETREKKKKKKVDVGCLLILMLAALRGSVYA